MCRGKLRGDTKMSYSFRFCKGQDLQQTNGKGHWRDGWMDGRDGIDFLLLLRGEDVGMFY